MNDKEIPPFPDYSGETIANPNYGNKNSNDPYWDCLTIPNTDPKRPREKWFCSYLFLPMLEHFFKLGKPESQIEPYEITKKQAYWAAVELVKLHEVEKPHWLVEAMLQDERPKKPRNNDASLNRYTMEKIKGIVNDAVSLKNEKKMSHDDIMNTKKHPYRDEVKNYFKAKYNISSTSALEEKKKVWEEHSERYENETSKFLDEHLKRIFG